MLHRRVERELPRRDQWARTSRRAAGGSARRLDRRAPPAPGGRIARARAHDPGGRRQERVAAADALEQREVRARRERRAPLRADVEAQVVRQRLAVSCAGRVRADGPAAVPQVRPAADAVPISRRPPSRRSRPWTPSPRGNRAPVGIVGIAELPARRSPPPRACQPAGRLRTSPRPRRPLRPGRPADRRPALASAAPRASSPSASIRTNGTSPRTSSARTSSPCGSAAFVSSAPSSSRSDGSVSRRRRRVEHARSAAFGR